MAITVAAYYRSLYFSLDNPEDLELLGLLLALPRWRQPSAIKSALRQYLPTVLDTPPLDPDEVRNAVANPARRARRRAADAPSGPSTAPDAASTRRIVERDAETSGSKDAPDLQTAERLLGNRLELLTKSRWIG